MTNGMKKPSYFAYTVVEGKGEKDKDYWLKIGAAYPHEKGDGLNVLLEAMPLDGKLVLRTPKTETEIKA